MSQALTTNVSGGSLAAAYEGGFNPFADAATAMGAMTGKFLKFDGNTGEYTYGTDGSEELVLGTKVAVNLESIQRGFICWKNEKVVDELMIAIQNGRPPSMDSLPDHGPYAPPEPGEEQGDGWREQSQIEFVDGAGGRFTMTTTSKSGIRGLANLLADIGKQFRLHPGEVPLVTLDNTSFQAKNGKGKNLGKKYAPVLKVVDWIGEDALIPASSSAPAADEDGSEDPANYTAPAATAPVKEVKPKKPVVKKPEPPPPPPPPPEPEPEEEEEEVQPEEVPEQPVERAAPPVRANKRF